MEYEKPIKIIGIALWIWWFFGIPFFSPNKIPLGIGLMILTVVVTAWLKGLKQK